MTVQLFCGNNLDILPSIPSQSVDAVITDSPYPHIKRDYGMWTTEQWWALIVEGVIPEVRRILKPTGSAVFILQPNSEHIGQMRGWLFEFQAWICREWNMVQDAYWWNITAMPIGGAPTMGLMRPSLKHCVWCGPADCHREQARVLWSESIQNRTARTTARNVRISSPSGRTTHRRKITSAALKRGGVTPFNVIPIPRTNAQSSNGASTPLELADWWTRYICPPGGTVVDPFVGSGTMMLAALQNECNGIGIDKEQRYIDVTQKRVDEAMAEMVQAEMPLHAGMTRQC